MTDDKQGSPTYQVGRHDASLIPLDFRTFRDIVEHSPDMISLHDPGGVYQYVSPAAQTLLGYRPYDLEGHNAYEFFHPEDLAAIQASHDQIMDRVETQTVRYRIRMQNGDHVWFETTSRTIRNPHTGEPERIIAVSRLARGKDQQVAELLVDDPPPASTEEDPRRPSRGP